MNNEANVQTIDFESNIEQGSGFKIKLTNLRKVYPTNTPAVSDINKFNIGDYIVRHRAENVIYQVVGIVREPIAPATLDLFMKKVTSSNGSVIHHLQRFHPYLLEYKKNGNFGVCRVYYKTVLRGGKRRTNGRLMSFWELDQIHGTNYGKIDISEAVKLQDISIIRAQRKIDQYNALVRQHQTRLSNSKAFQAELRSLLPQSTIVQIDPVVAEQRNEETQELIGQLIAA